MSIEPGQTVPKDPDAKTFHEMQWAAWLVSGAIIASYLITIDSDGVLDYDSDGLSQSDTAVRFRLIDGTPGTRYKVTVHIVTNEAVPQEDDRSFFVQVRQR